MNSRIGSHRVALPETSISARPVQRRLMIFLAALLFILVGIFAVVIVIQRQERLNQSSLKIMKQVSGNLARLLAEQSRAMVMLEDLLARDTGLLKSLKAGDRDNLLAVFEPVFVKLREKYNITHFYLHHPDRVNLLRIHKPEKYGDRIERYTMDKAARTGQVASGIELGPLGTFTLRVVKPVFENNTLLGYLELGKEIEDILAGIHQQSGVELAVTIRKNALNRADWEMGMKMLGRSVEWEQFPNDALIFSTLSPFPAEFKRFVGEAGHTHGDPTAEAFFKGKTWRIMNDPLIDASGTEVGDLIVMHDISKALSTQNRLMAVAAGGALLLLMGMFGFLFVLLRRTDQGIYAQQVKMQQNHARLLSIFDGVDEPVYVADPDTYEVLYINNATRKSFGRVNNRKCYEYLQNRERQCPFCTNQKIFGEYMGKSYVWEFQNEINQRWYRCIDKAIAWPDGRMVRHEMAMDITERKQAEEALQNAKNFMDSIIGSMADILVVISPTGEVVMVNQATCRLLGFFEEEIIGKPANMLLEEDSSENRERPVKRSVLRRLVKNDSIKNVEVYLLKKSGEKIPALLSGSVMRNDRGKIQGVVCLAIDMTERKQIEFERNRLISAIEQSGEIIIITDTKGIIQYVNRHFEYVTGYTKGEAVGQNPRILKSNMQDEAFYREMWEHISSGKTWEGRIVNRKKDGMLFTEEATISPMKDAAGRIVNYVAVKRDITEQLRLQNEKVELEKQYYQAQKVESIGRLAGGVAHDLNNLLSPIIGYGEMLMDDLDPDEDRREFVDEILQAGFRARNLVRQLLAFSRKQTLEYRPVDMNKVVLDFEKLLKRTIREDIAIEIIPSPDIGKVMADIGQIEQVIMNLSVNAQDAMPEGGQLTIETSSATLDKAYASKHPGVQPGLYVMLAISDTGYGMDDKTREQIFEPFFSTKGEQGTGLGLATVYGIIKQHDGNIWVYSEPGVGTTFKAYLPVSKDVSAKEKIRNKTAISLKGTEVILLVEDNEQVRQLAHAILRRQGYMVLVAKSGTEALAALSAYAHPIDLLLTDVVMPEMNGKDLFLKVAEEHPNLKVLYMSGYTDNVIVHRGVLEEGTAFIQKPFTVRSLSYKIREVLKQD